MSSTILATLPAKGTFPKYSMICLKIIMFYVEYCYVRCGLGTITEYNFEYDFSYIIFHNN